MADKGKKGKAGAAPAAPAAPHPPGAKGQAQPGQKKVEEIELQQKSVQPRDEVGTRKGCRRYRWELKDSNREFWFMGHAVVKLLSVGCLTGAMVMFTGIPVHPILTLIVTMELSVFIFFIVVYTFAVSRYMSFILWPITDIINDLCAAIFLVGAAVFAVQIRQTMPTNYLIAVILIGLAAFFPLIDICLQRKHFRSKKIKRHELVPPQPKVVIKTEDETKKKEAAKPAGKAGGKAKAKGGKK